MVLSVAAGRGGTSWFRGLEGEVRNCIPQSLEACGWWRTSKVRAGGGFTVTPESAVEASFVFVFLFVSRNGVQSWRGAFEVRVTSYTREQTTLLGAACFA